MTTTFATVLMAGKCIHHDANVIYNKIKTLKEAFENIKTRGGDAS